jgi:hypothetical protein
MSKEQDNMGQDLIRVTADALESVHRAKTRAGSGSGGLTALARDAARLGLDTASAVIDLHASYADVLAEALGRDAPSTTPPQRLRGQLERRLEHELLFENTGRGPVRFGFLVSEVRPLEHPEARFRPNLAFTPEAPQVGPGELTVVRMTLELAAPFRAGDYQLEVHVRGNGVPVHRQLFLITVQDVGDATQ